MGIRLARPLTAAVLCALCGCSLAVAPAPAHTRLAQVWLTTGDQARLLHREADVAFTGAAAALPVIDVDTGTRYQRMVGFGAAFTDASVHLIQHAMSPAQRDALLSELFARNGIGFSFARVPMGASDFSLRHYSYDDVPAGQVDAALASFSINADRADKLPVIRRALAINPRLTLVASPWSAPAWMKTNGSLIGGTLAPEWEEAYARYFVKFIQSYGQEGVRIAAVTLQNEPDHEPTDYPGMRLDPPARARLIRQVGRVFDFLALGTQIWDWDHNWDKPEQPLAVLADSVARRHVSAVAWHCYGGGVAAQSTVRDAHPDKDVYFTECAGGDWAPVFADNLRWNVANLVIGATRHWARGVALWNLALDERGGPHTGGCGNCRGVVTINSATGEVARNVEYYALAHASRFVRPAAVRVASPAAVDGLMSVAFQNADDGSRVLVVLNDSAAPRRFVVRERGSSFSYTLPAGAVATFVWT